MLSAETVTEGAKAFCYRLQLFQSLTAPSVPLLIPCIPINMPRPKLELDAPTIERLASYGLTGEEIADALGCSRQTLYARFSDSLKRGHSDLKISLKRAQVSAALKGNIVMLVWLGKQYLNQREPIRISEITDEELRAYTESGEDADATERTKREAA